MYVCMYVCMCDMLWMDIFEMQIHNYEPHSTVFHAILWHNNETIFIKIGKRSNNLAWIDTIIQLNNTNNCM